MHVLDHIIVHLSVSPLAGGGMRKDRKVFPKEWSGMTKCAWATKGGRPHNAAPCTAPRRHVEEWADMACAWEEDEKEPEGRESCCTVRSMGA